jgi:hypothetical protein
VTRRGYDSSDDDGAPRSLSFCAGTSGVSDLGVKKGSNADFGRVLGQ